MISTTTITCAARVALQGYLTAAFFKVIVIDRTVLVVSRSEKVSISFVTSTVCSSTAVLLLATAKAARQFLSDDVQHVPVLRDVDDIAEPNARFAGGKVADTISTTKAFGAPAQPSSSPAVIESTKPAFDGPTEGLLTTDSDATLICRDEDLAKDVFSGDHVSDIDSEWLADESTFYEVTAQCLADEEPEHTLHAEYDSHTINNLIRTMSTLSLDDVPSRFSILFLDNVPSPISTISLDNVPSNLSPLDDVPSPFDLTLSFDNVSFEDVLADKSTFYEHDCQATAQCLTDDEPERAWCADCDSYTIDSLIRRMSTLSLDNVPPHISTQSLDDVSSPVSSHSLGNVSPPIPTQSLNNVPSPVSTLYLDNVPSHLSTLPPHHALYDHTIDTQPDSSQPSKHGLTHVLDDHTIAHLPRTLPPGSPQSSKCQPQYTLVHDYPIDISTHSLDNVASHTSTVSLDSVPSPFLTHSLDDVASHTSTISLADVPCDLSPSLDDVPSRISTISLADVTPHLSPSLDNVSFDDVPSHLSPLLPHLDICSTQSSKSQPRHTAVHDHAIDNLIRKMVALSLDNVPYQLSKLQPHLHDHAIGALLQKSDALTLDENPAIDALLQKSDALSLDDNHAIKTLLRNSDALALDDSHAIETLLPKSDALSLDDNHAIETLLCTSDALALDDSHTVESLLPKPDALPLDDNHGFDALLRKSDAHTLDDDASQSSKYMPYNNINDSPSHRPLCCNTPLRDIEAIDPRNFNYDSPYTTMLSTPYFETWNLLFLTIVPRNHQNVSRNAPY